RAAARLGARSRQSRLVRRQGSLAQPPDLAVSAARHAGGRRGGRRPRVRRGACHSRAMSDIPPVYSLRNYALLADGERGALIDPEGNVAWMCAPRWHDPAIFSSLIGG